MFASKFQNYLSTCKNANVNFLQNVDRRFTQHLAVSSQKVRQFIDVSVEEPQISSKPSLFQFFAAHVWGRQEDVWGRREERE